MAVVMGMRGDKDGWLGFNAGSSNTLGQFITAILPELKKDESPEESPKAPDEDKPDLYKIINDSGHGWLKVPIEFINPEDYSGFSYKDEDFAYLEEDQDAADYYRLTPNLDTSKIQRVNFDEPCHIRDMDRLNDKYLSSFRHSEDVVINKQAPKSVVAKFVEETHGENPEDEITVTYKMAEQPIQELADKYFPPVAKKTPQVHWEKDNEVGIPVTKETPDLEITKKPLDLDEITKKLDLSFPVEEIQPLIDAAVAKASLKPEEIQKMVDAAVSAMDIKHGTDGTPGRSDLRRAHRRCAPIRAYRRWPRHRS
jgi:hypothetical protein